MRKGCEAQVLEEAEESSVLVDQARGGDSSAMEALVRKYQQRIAGFVYMMIGKDAALEDICQNVFVKMIVGLHSLKSTAKFESWLFQVARNVCFDHLRKERLRRLFLPFKREHEQIAAPIAHTEKPLESFQRALAELAPKQRELILLLQDQDWSYDDLARITRSSVSSVKSRLFRARQELKRRMNDEV